MAARKGFTLIELMVVISIIAILAAIGITAYSKTQLAARDSRRKSDIKSLRSSLELYFQKYGGYPPVGYDDKDGKGTWPAGTSYCDYLGDLLQPQVKNALLGIDVNGNQIATAYTNALPQDPTYGNNQWGYYYWLFGPGGGQYNLMAALENTSDSQVVTPPALASCANYPSSGPNKYNYVLTNP